MKYALVFIATVVATSSAFADRYCLNAKQTYNSHPSIACPAVSQICVKNLDTTRGKESAKSIILVDSNGKKTLQLPFSSYSKEHDSDIASHLIYSFYKDGVYAAYEVETDESYPYPTVTGTFNRLSVHTNKTSNDNSVYSSQYCAYETVKNY